uniref:DUF5641 domain-containing protein n=2 Tax=Lutzomyia longipalpis TaxID=7200 RepID=A0A1B0CDM8_LUTLO
MDPITPAHLMGLEEPLIFPPEQDLLDQRPNSLSRLDLCRRMGQDFWNKWHAEYITSLQQRSKWNKQSENLKIGDLCLIKGDNLKSGEWKLGRVTDVVVGSEGVVRKVTLKTEKGVTSRHANKLAKLPLE